MIMMRVSFVISWGGLGLAVEVVSGLGYMLIDCGYVTWSLNGVDTVTVSLVFMSVHYQTRVLSHPLVST